MDQNDFLSTMQRILKKGQGRVRVKLTHESEPTGWSSWIISPVPGYLEIERYGPFLLRETTWFEIQPPLLAVEMIHEPNFPALEINEAGTATRFIMRPMA